MTIIQLVRFLAPEFELVDDRLVNTAIQLAGGYRPQLLSPAKQDEAQALYAAWLLSTRQGDDVGGGSSTSLVLEKEGDQTRQYGLPINEQATLAQRGNYRARYDALVGPLMAGAIMTGHRQASTPSAGRELGGPFHLVTPWR